MYIHFFFLISTVNISAYFIKIIQKKNIYKQYYVILKHQTQFTCISTYDYLYNLNSHFRFDQKCVDKTAINLIKMYPYLEVWKCRLRLKELAEAASSTLT